MQKKSYKTKITQVTGDVEYSQGLSGSFRKWYTVVILNLAQDVLVEMERG